MLIKTLLNKFERFKSYFYGALSGKLVDGEETLGDETFGC